MLLLFWLQIDDESMKFMHDTIKEKYIGKYTYHGLNIKHEYVFDWCMEVWLHVCDVCERD